MRIQILSVEISTKVSKAGKNYQNAEVAFKNFDTGKVESKNITQYSKIYKLLAEAQAGQTAEIGVVKNDGGYWEWDSFKRIVMTEQEKTAVDVPNVKAANVVAAKSTYETPEERAKKQIYIIKQSSLANAITFLGGSTTGATLDEVLRVAQVMSDWVVDEKKVDLFDLPNDIEVS